MTPEEAFAVLDELGPTFVFGWLWERGHVPSHPSPIDTQPAKADSTIGPESLP